MTDPPPEGVIWIRSEDVAWMINAIRRIDVNVQNLLSAEAKTETTMAAMEDAITALTTQVQSNASAEASAVQLIERLAGLITDNANDPAAIAALATQLKGSADALAAAITANTPAAPAPATT